MCIWNVATGESEAVLEGHWDWVNSVAFSPDGSHVVSGTIVCTVHIWNVAAGESEAVLKEHYGSVHSVIFSPDGSHAMSRSHDGTVRIWNVATCESEKLENHFDNVNDSVVFSPDGSHVMSRSDNGIIYIWDTVTSASLVLQDLDHELLLSGIPSLYLDSTRTWIVHTGSGLQYVTIFFHCSILVTIVPLELSFSL